MWPHDATIEFEYETTEQARIVARSIGREIHDLQDDRSRASVSRDGHLLLLTIDARDVSALRAALNTWTTLIDVVERVDSIATRSSDRP